jgi:Zn-dependent M28 family amino/carboxypeptidase
VAGLLGSQYYVTHLQQTNKTELNNIALNLNFDMIGSPNFIRGIYNGSSGTDSVKKGSTIIQQLFEHYFESHWLPYTLTPFNGRSDYGPFINVHSPL